MSLKFSLIFGFLCILVGIYAGSRINMHKSEPSKQAEKSSEKKSGVIKKYAPPKKEGGAPVLVEEEVYTSEAKSESKPQDNLLFLTDTKLKEASVIFKIEHFHIGLGYDFSDKEILYKLGYSTRIF